MKLNIHLRIQMELNDIFYLKRISEMEKNITFEPLPKLVVNVPLF